MGVFYQILKKNLYLFTAFVLFVSITSWTVYRILQDNTQQSIRGALLSAERVVIYSKENCRFCQKAQTLLALYNIKYSVIDITNNYALHIALAQKTNQSTVPYLFINDKFLGGYLELQNILESQ